MNPEISVLMPAYNVEKYIGEAVSSILNQVFSDFELIILNDGSSDNTSEIIRSFDDERIIFIDDNINKGKILRLNQGLSLSRGKYIAIMDADDISEKNRLLKQFKFLENNSNTGACGIWIHLFGEKNEVIRNPVNNEEIYLHLLNGCCFAMPLIRKDIIKRHNLSFENDFWPEDYMLWIKLANLTNLYTIPEVLYYYRIHHSQISKSKKITISEGAARVKNIHFRKMSQKVLGDNYIDCPDLLNHHNFTLKELIKIGDHIELITDANRQSKQFNQQLIERKLSRLWYKSFYSLEKIDKKVIKYFIQKKDLREKSGLTLINYAFFGWNAIKGF